MMRGGKSRGFVCAVVVVTFWGLTCVFPATATITTMGDIVPAYDDVTDPWVLSSDLTIGQDADAAIWVAGGSQIQEDIPGHYTSVIAAGADVTACATVSGADSVWGVFVMVGGYGNGTMTVENGALLDTGGIWAGTEAGSIGNVLLTGPGTIWQGEAESKISIDGDPVDPNEGYQHYVRAHIGNHGTGSLTVSDGARVVSDGGSVYLGYFADGVGSLTVTGPNSVWEETGEIRIGHLGTGTLLISDGGVVNSTGTANIGNWPAGVSRGSATVTDPGSLWRIDGGLYVGGAGTGELLISNGGRVESEYAHISYSEGDSNTVTVTGPGSLWQNERYLVVGHFERGWLRVEDGGRVTDANAYVGWKAGSNGLVQVTGDGSAWDTSHELRLGDAGSATLYIEDGGRVTSRTGILGVESTGVGVALVTGPDSVWENLQDPNTGLGGDLYVGYSGIGDLAIGSGGRVASVEGLVGHMATGDGEVIVDGVGSLWENELSIQIGVAGTGHLSISGGATVTTNDAFVGSDPTGEGTIAVEGAGSALEVEQDLIVGVYGHGDLSISGGGQVSAADVTLASDAGSIASATITGEDSLLTIADHLNIGGSGDANMVISNGGRLVGVAVIVAADPNGTGTVAVTGSGSRLTGVNLDVGERGHGNVAVSDGGVASAIHTILGSQVGSVGSATVAGNGSAWNNMGILDVGYAGDGQVILSDGGQMSSATGRIGVLAGGRGVVSLTDANSLWTNSGALYVGGDETHAAGTGSLILGEGTRVASNSIRIWNTGSLQGAGTVAADVVVDGTVRPGNSIGTLTIDGDVTFDPCSVLEVEISNAAADKLAVTGDVEIAGGTVRTIATETIVGSHQYAIVEANGVSGQFDALDTALLDSFVYLKAAELGYGPGSALLTVTSTPFDDPNVARTCNQASLGSVLQQTAEEGGNDVTTALQQLQTGGEVEAAYNQLSGQTTPSLAPVTVAGTTRHVGAIAGRLRNPAGGVSSAEGFDESSMAFAAGDTMSPDAGRYLFAAGNGTPVLGEKPWGVWGKGYGLYGDRESESGVPGYQYTVYGAAFGLDYRFTERLLLGFTGGYSQGDVDYSDSRDNSDVSATHAGVYGGYDTQHWYLDSILTYTALEYETRRFVDLLDERLEADPSGDMLTAYFEAGLNWRCGERTLIQPLAGLQLSTLKIDGFTETGGDGALTFDDQRYDSYKGSLGTRLTRQLFKRENGSRMELELRGRWVHEFGDTKASLDAGFASDPGATFRVSDGDIARDSAVLGAGLDTWFTRQTRLFVDYGTELNPDNTIQVVTAGLEHRW